MDPTALVDEYGLEYVSFSALLIDLKVQEIGRIRTFAP